MIDGPNEKRRVVAVVPARGGSKGVPLKNIKSLGGKPLLAWSIEAAQAVPEIDRVLVSTDHPEIARVAREYGAEVMERPPELARDDSLVKDALRDIAARLKDEGESAAIMVLLEPTCPLRSPDDIAQCLRLLADSSQNYNAVATFKDAELNPHRAWRIEGQAPRPFIGGAVPWTPRQQLPPAYQLNGAVYAFEIATLEEPGPALLNGLIGAVVMPRERSVDIDNALDFLVAEAMLSANDVKRR